MVGWEVEETVIWKVNSKGSDATLAVSATGTERKRLSKMYQTKKSPLQSYKVFRFPVLSNLRDMLEVVNGRDMIFVLTLGRVRSSAQQSGAG